MMKYEFEALAGYQVSDEDYKNYIEPMYMALPEDITKDKFVKMVSKERFALPSKRQIINQMKKIAKYLFDICGHCTDWKAEEDLEHIAKQYAKRFHNLDWNNDIECFVYTVKEYEFPQLKRGCTFPKKLVIGKGNTVYEEITLVKDSKYSC